MYDYDIFILECDKALFLNMQTQCRIAISINFFLFYVINDFCVEQNLLIAPIKYCHLLKHFESFHGPITANPIVRIRQLNSRVGMTPR